MATRFAILLEIPERRHGGVGCIERGRHLAGETLGTGKALARVLLKSGFVVEGLDVTHAAAHEEKDAVLRLAAQMRLPGGERVQCGRSSFQLVGQNVHKGQAADAVPGAAEEIPAGSQIGDGGIWGLS